MAPRLEPLSHRPLALTMGDPAGIGLEIAVKAWHTSKRERVPAFAVFGDAAAAQAAIERLGVAGSVVCIDEPHEALQRFHDALPVVHIPLARPSVPGVPDSANGPAIVAAIDRATRAAVDGQAGAVVTSPIAKSVVYAAGFAHPGHTEYLAALADVLHPATAPHTPIMMLAGPTLKVVPLTIHVPLAAVPALITPALIETAVRIVATALQQDFTIADPRIAVAGLNPHAGESGTIGREDRDIIAPTIDRLAASGIRVTGPHAADTLFHDAARQRYDVVIAMYHDQALIPIKTLAFDDAVNVTLGLPFIRTSPDHGTAFDIAGRGIARPDSLLAALRLAAEISATRAGAKP